MLEEIVEMGINRENLEEFLVHFDKQRQQIIKMSCGMGRGGRTYSRDQIAKAIRCTRRRTSQMMDRIIERIKAIIAFNKPIEAKACELPKIVTADDL